MPVRVSRASSVIVHRVPPAAADRFLALQDEFTRAVEGFAGYQGTDVYPPADPAGTEWVVLIHFTDVAALNGWLNSPARADWVKRVQAEIGEFRLETLSAGFGAWFTDPTRGTAAPAAWKIVMTVVLGLYPTVMLLSRFVGPYTNPLGMAAAMLIGNALSVSILQWGVMPVLSKAFAPWLSPARPSARGAAVGAGIILLLLAGMVLGFRTVTG